MVNSDLQKILEDEKERLGGQPDRGKTTTTLKAVKKFWQRNYKMRNQEGQQTLSGAPD